MPAEMGPNGPLAPPSSLQEAGRELWTSVLEEFELEVHERTLLLQACRCADYLDRLAEDAFGQPVTVENGKGDKVARPSITEHRQQSIALSRMLATLRLPTGDEAEARPQRRGGARGPYGPRTLELHAVEVS